MICQNTACGKQIDDDLTFSVSAHESNNPTVIGCRTYSDAE